ncbi:50S ribosomal protein L10 [Patescibacteria group bacterium]
MAITRAKKEEIYKKTSDILNDSESVVFVNFHGLGVADTTKLRSDLRNEEVGYSVLKKTIVKKALDESKAEGEVPELEGELALVYGKDAIAPARGVHSFYKEHKDNIQILGGIFQGKYVGKEEMMSIAQIPPVNVLYGQFVNLINSPIQRMAVVLDQIAEKKS